MCICSKYDDKNNRTVTVLIIISHSESAVVEQKCHANISFHRGKSYAQIISYKQIIISAR